MGGFIVTIPIRFILYTIYIAPHCLSSTPSSLLNPLLSPLKAIARGFLVLFHVGM
jgi:hypothetical protein